MSPHPHAGEEWFRKLPLERQVEMAREHEARLQRPGELARIERRRVRVEALQMGGVFALFGWICADPASLFLSGAIGAALGWICSRLDLKRLSTAVLGMTAFLGVMYLVHGWVWLVLFGTFPLGACCALIGWAREERGT